MSSVLSVLPPRGGGKEERTFQTKEKAAKAKLT